VGFAARNNVRQLQALAHASPTLSGFREIQKSANLRHDPWGRIASEVS
jgi:hypothetical protein